MANINVLNIDHYCDICAFLDEPNNSLDISPSGEDCLALVYLYNVLNDAHCTFKSLGYVCEKDSKLENQYSIYVDGAIK